MVFALANGRRGRGPLGGGLPRRGPLSRAPRSSANGARARGNVLVLWEQLRDRHSMPWGARPARRRNVKRDIACWRGHGVAASVGAGVGLGAGAGVAQELLNPNACSRWQLRVGIWDLCGGTWDLCTGGLGLVRMVHDSSCDLGELGLMRMGTTVYAG